MRRKRLLLYVIAAGFTAIVALFLIVYFVIFPTSSPKPFKLSTSTSAAASTASGSTTSSPSSAASSALAGKWSVTSGSQAGYRVREKLAFLPAESDAVGRTSQITGNVTLHESGGNVTIDAAWFQIAVNTLKSDRSMRDEKIHQVGLESDRYPTARFTLSSPLTIPAGTLKGKLARVPVTGTVEIHGTAKRETLPVEMTVSGSTFEAAGSLKFPWSEFGMTAPSIGGFVNVTEKATMEFDLRLQRS